VDLNRAGTPAVPHEALRYARLLERGTWLGLVLLLLSFLAYVSGWWDPHVPLQRLPQLWQLPVGAYLQASSGPQGWAWLALATRADYANLLGIAVLASCSIPSLLAVIPLFVRQGTWAYAIICMLEIAVLLLAASGWLGAGH